MEIALTPEAHDVIGQAVAAGHVKDAGEAVRQAVALWVEHERRRIELLSAIDQAETSITRDGGTAMTEKSMGNLAADVKRRGRARLKAAQ